MFKKEPATDLSVQFPVSLQNAPLFDTDGNVWCVTKDREKIFKLFPKTTITLTKHSTTKPFIDSQVETAVTEMMHLWREQYALPTLSKITPRAYSYLEECTKEAKRSCMKKLLEVLDVNGAQCFEEIVKDVLQEMEKLVTKKIALAQEIVKQSPQLLPCGTRFHWQLKSEQSDYQIFCIENAPQQRTLHIMEETRRLALPWIYFIVIFRDGYLENLYVFYRDASLTNLDDMLYLPNLPNIQSQHLTCCLGNNPFVSLKNDNWSETLFTYFWGSSFFETRDSFIEFYEDAKKRIPELKDLETWEKMSIQNPLFVLKLPWKKALTLRTLIGKCLVRFKIATKIATAQQKHQDSWNNIQKRYAVDFGKELAIRLHTLCTTLSPNIDTARIAHERLIALFKELERDLLRTLNVVHASISDILSTSITQTMQPDAEEKPP
ncbi:MAG: hypothetical protein HZA36_03545 [Parcubacteria group bacterium]|nr:hypothetical protein [Parcubacteria group bacterium]